MTPRDPVISDRCLDTKLVLESRLGDSPLAAVLSVTVRDRVSAPPSTTRYFMELARLWLPRFFRSTTTSLMACFRMIVRIFGSSGIWGPSETMNSNSCSGVLAGFIFCLDLLVSMFCQTLLGEELERLSGSSCARLCKWAKSHDQSAAELRLQCRFEIGSERDGRCAYEMSLRLNGKRLTWLMEHCKRCGTF
jgi:hypothetical protein